MAGLYHFYLPVVVYTFDIDIVFCFYDMMLDVFLFSNKSCHYTCVFLPDQSDILHLQPMRCNVVLDLSNSEMVIISIKLELGRDSRAAR